VVSVDGAEQEQIERTIASKKGIKRKAEIFQEQQQKQTKKQKQSRLWVMALLDTAKRRKRCARVDQEMLIPTAIQFRTWTASAASQRMPLLHDGGGQRLFLGKGRRLPTILYIYI